MSCYCGKLSCPKCGGWGQNDPTPQDKGRRFENDFARSLNVEPQRGSGNQWTARMDIADGTILWSCKATDKRSFRFTAPLMKEAQDAITGPGGIGGDAIPGLAISVDHEIFVMLRAEDFLRLAEDNISYITPSKGEHKRKQAKVPLLMREEKDD